MTIPWRKVRIGILVVVVLAAGYAGSRWLASDPLQQAANDAVSVEDEWAKTIRKFGIEPVFPPEEDLTVGDVLAVIVKDNEPNPESKDAKISARTPLLKRAVKLAHIDVRKALRDAYQVVPVFTAPSDPRPSTQVAGKASAPPPAVTRYFGEETIQSDLPRAAFPKLKVQGSASANSGFAASLRGFAGYAIGNTGLEELYLTEVRAYGLPSADAEELLKAYCTNEKTRNVCLEKTARKHLERIVGDNIYRKYIYDKRGNERFAITVDVVMVNRVYLARAIRNLNQSGMAESARVAFGQRTEAAQQSAADPAAAGASAERVELDAMKKRVADLEKQLSNATGGAAGYGRSHDRESLLNESFDRPVAIGYRSVRFDTEEDAAAK